MYNFSVLLSLVLLIFILLQDYLEILSDTPAETEEDASYDEVHFDKIPDEYFWPSGLGIHDPEALPGADAQAGSSDKPAKGYGAHRIPEKDLHKEGEDTGF